MLRNSNFRFTLPVILENTATTMIGLVVASVVGGISGSSLAAISMANVVLSILTAFSGFLTTGSAVLVARCIGEGDHKQASAVVEQSVFIAVVFSLALTVLCEGSAEFVMRLLLPVSEPQVFKETLDYYRILMLSFPFLTLYTTLGGELRAAGDSRTPMLAAVAVNLVQLAVDWLLISRMHMDVAGAGLGMIVCRAVGMGMLIFASLNAKRYFVILFRNVIHPCGEIIRHIVRLGLPAAFESAAVQGGYLLANSIAMSLGTQQANIFQITSTLNGFSCLPEGICSAAVMTFVGHKLGAKDYEGAKYMQRRTMLYGLVSTLALYAILMLGQKPFISIYTGDVFEQTESARVLWVLLGHVIFGMMINVNDPVLRTAGDMRYVMIVTVTCVWLIRLPLTVLFCQVLRMGAMGCHLANVISLFARAALGQMRIRRGKWVYLKV